MASLFTTLFSRIGLIKRPAAPTVNVSTSPSVNDEQPIPAALIDHSLRANAASYRERRREVSTIFKRIQSNMSSVIGISGVRGAGKSSLALKILSLCADKGYFTVTISSPTAYDSKEFMLTLYQAICEDIKMQIEQKFQTRKPLFEQAMLQRRSNYLKKYFVMSMIGILAIALITGAYNFVFVNTKARSERQRLTYVKQRHYKAKTTVDSLTRTNAGNPYVRYATNAKNYTPHNDSLAVLYFQLKDAASRDSALMDTLTRSVSKDSARLSFPNVMSVPGSIIGMNYINLPLILFFMIAAAGGYLAIVSAIRGYDLNIKNSSRYPKEWALLKVTQEKLEWLVYQVKVSSANEVSVPIAKFAAKFSRAKELQARPLSLPGVTADFNDFVKDVAGVYGKVVICIDELDKIGAAEELDALLKGIKGVLGQSDTHFIMTVSEDALAKFTTRLRKQRDIIESSFEEIYLLDRISLELSEAIIKTAEAIHDDDTALKTYKTNCLLLWLFGNGIPREIKRNLLVISRNDLNAATSDSFSVWRTLLLNATDSATAWTLINDTDGEAIAFKLLRCLEYTRISLPQQILTTAEAKEWFKSLAYYYATYFPDIYSKLTEEVIANANNDPAKPDQIVTSNSNCERSLIELMLLALSVIFITNDDVSEGKVSARMLGIFEVLPYNSMYAVALFQKILKELQIQLQPIEQLSA